MDIFKEKLSSHSGGKILDVATGKGEFMELLRECLKDYTEMTGIDLADRALQIARENYTDENIHIVKMSAEKLDYPDHTFDTVSISNSLHHFPDISIVLKEMYRVLKPGGLFIIKEMYYDLQSETQQTHRLMHHWSAEIERILGRCHDETWTREQILQVVETLPLRDLDIFDYYEEDDDPFDPEGLEFVANTCDRVLGLIEGYPEYAEMQARSEVIKQRARQVGITAFLEITILGRK